ncbi:hypothetical protein Pmani_002325 [Petrolisthes manimaculis]|uniref:U3 small nucleolar RNA-associated protein 15 homolog n=1 Tax=Petrolisthes manimaculis TaxID=1843537 RepID=A0AAE1QHS1_9EUCA|nr:hypothetical protein Pmani_002325 [Petrolisthes manimaculis]
MAAFKKTSTRAYTRRKITPDAQYWKKLQFPVTVKEFTAIDYVDICPTEPHHIAVTSGPKVDVYHRETMQLLRTVSRFQRLAYGAKFRPDGQLLLAGSEEGQVKLFRQKQLLRIFKGHGSATHRVDFMHGLPQIATFSDDKTALVWDMADESKLCTLTGHTDFIRAGVCNPASAHLVLTGSYDHTVRLWDTRTGTSVSTVAHGAPVESLLFFPAGGLFVSAGGTEVRVWDTIAGKLLAKVSQHHKTITCLGLASNGQRLLSGSLDQRVKVYDINTYTVAHSLEYPAPVLSLAVAPGDSTLAVGMISAGSGLLSFQHRAQPEAAAPDTSVGRTKVGNIRNVISDDYFKVQPGDQIVPFEMNRKMEDYDRLLCKFEYSKVLDLVMGRYNEEKTAHVAIGVFQELIRRQGLKAAVSGRSIGLLHHILKFTIEYIRYPAYKQVLTDVANCLIDVYGDSLHEIPGLAKGFRRLRKEIATEITSCREDISMIGALQMFLTASTPHLSSTSTNIQHLTASSNICNSDVQKALQPSVSARSSEAVIVEVS